LVLTSDGTPGLGVAAAFTVELTLNLYGNWWSKFGYDYWNWFDAVVVAISLVSLLFGGVEGIGALRLLRAFRVVRLFKRAASLRKILKAINQAIPGMRDAFAILMLVMMLYAIMGVRAPAGEREGGTITHWVLLPAD
jgi:hypothetical protein